jgi:hypothetical protein
LHPVRWFLCLVGLLLTALSAAVAMSLFDRAPPDLAGWWQQPLEHAQEMADVILGGSLGRLILRGGPLLALNTALLCLIGGWIARHELVARGGTRAGTTEMPVEPTATAFLVGSWRSLLVCCPIVLFLGLFLLQPVLLAGRFVTWFGGPGALVVSVLLPVVLVVDLALLFVALGAPAWPLMPVALAAECVDQFDAISRSYSYIFQRPLRFLLLTATALGPAAIPLVVVYLLVEKPAAWQPGARQAVWWPAAGLSASIFWSLQTLVYLHMRLVIDGVDAGEVAAGPLSRGVPRAPSHESKSAEVPALGGRRPIAGRSLARGTIEMLAAATGSWCLTFWLLTRAAGGQAEWLGWGLSETFIPPAEGVYRAASVIAGIWGVAWLALCVILAVRLLLRGRARRVERARDSH